MTEHALLRSAVARSAGVTPSEQYLATLAERSFLNLWCYPNVFIDKRTGPGGDGKELCDLLVVCGHHVLIFSDKTVSWPEGDDIKLAWTRWFRRAIYKSVEQIRGAERWITNFPRRIFLDKRCTQPFPLSLPPPETRKIHGIVVALGAGDACKAYYGEESGSLLIVPDIRGEDHWDAYHALPFVVGDLDPRGSFIHVLDDATLDIVMEELDTITDLTNYLDKKDKLIRSGQLISAAGEDELVAYYMTHMNPQREHDFTKPDGTLIAADERISIGVGFYAEMRDNAQYQAKKEADHVSYVWDRLIEAFTSHMLDGTTLVRSGEPFSLSEHEESVRHMALVPRYLRRSLGNGVLVALQRGRTADRFTRGFLPGSDEPRQDTAFFFMTLAIPKFQLTGGYERYREVRRNMLEVYALAMLRKHRKLKRVVGIATEPPSADERVGSSEDLIVAGQPNWTPELVKELRERKKIFNIFQQDNFAEYAVHDREFPEIGRDAEYPQPPKLSRAQRRAKAAESRRSRRKRGRGGRW